MLPRARGIRFTREPGPGQHRGARRAETRPRAGPQRVRGAGSGVRGPPGPRVPRVGVAGRGSSGPQAVPGVCGGGDRAPPTGPPIRGAPDTPPPSGHSPRGFASATKGLSCPRPAPLPPLEAPGPAARLQPLSSKLGRGKGRAYEARQPISERVEKTDGRPSQSSRRRTETSGNRLHGEGGDYSNRQTRRPVVGEERRGLAVGEPIRCELTAGASTRTSGAPLAGAFPPPTTTIRSAGCGPGGIPGSARGVQGSRPALG